MDSFLFDLFIKKSLIKALHKDINGLIGKLYAADEILTLFDSCLFDWRIVLNVSDREISVKNLIIPLFPKRQANRIVISWRSDLWCDLNGSYIPIFSANYLHAHHFVHILLYNLQRRFGYFRATISR